MVLVVDAFVTWLVEQVADAGRRRLITWVFGTEQERALRQAAVAAVQRTADDLSPGNGQRAGHIAMVVDQVFGEQLPPANPAGNATLLEALQAAIVGQLAPLDDAELTETGLSSADVLGVTASLLAERLTSHLLREIVIRGARGGPLTPLASHLNHELNFLQGKRIEDKVDLHADEILAGLARLESTLKVTQLAVTHTLPSEAVAFTGRQAELDQLIQAIPEVEDAIGTVRIAAIDGMAGVGKTAFAVHAAKHLASRFPGGQLFVRLHGHSPGQGPVEPADALAALLLGDGVAPQSIPPGLDARAGLWRDRLVGRAVLLVLDDAIDSQQVRPLLPGMARTLVLITSRRRLTALPEAIPVTLDVLPAAEAAGLFVGLVGRPGLVSDDAASEVVALCGFLPLAISLVAGQLKHHSTWTSAGLAVELKSAADRLAPMAAENNSVAASFSLSYNHLPATQQRLFRRLGLLPGSDIDVYAAASLDDADLLTARGLLDDLFSYHLIEEPARGRYRLHDLIREYARALVAADPAATQVAATDRLLNYYLHAARAADRHLARHTSAGIPDTMGSPPAHAPYLPKRQEGVAWMDAERLNLHAAVEYAAAHDRPGLAIAIAAVMHGYLRSQGHWDQALILHRAAIIAARHIGQRSAEAGALTDLAAIEQAKGDYRQATVGLTQALELCDDIGDRQGKANVLNYLGVAQFLMDDYPASTATLTQALRLCCELDDRLGEANAFNRLGIVRQLAGDYPAAADSLTRAIELFRDLGDQLGEAIALSNLGVVQYLRGDYLASVATLSRALELHRNLGDRHGEAGDLNHLGAVWLARGDYRTAAENLTRALKLNRDLGDRLGEATVLGDLGIVHFRTGDHLAAGETFTQALNLHRELEAPLGEAEVLNNLGELSLASAAPAQARTYHNHALAIATEIGSLLEEARALEGIGRYHLSHGHSDEGAAQLRKALTIYQSIGSPNAPRVEATLRDLGP
jgi:tetratricopeptide (TPR) repeat protein